MAAAEGCDYGKATRTMLVVLIGLAALVALGSMGIAGFSRSDVKANRTQISGLSERLARIEERQQASATILNRIERKLNHE